jgi:hypothetical protein
MGRPVKETDVMTWNGTAWERTAAGAIYGYTSGGTAAATLDVGGTYAQGSGCSIAADGSVSTNGNLVVDGTTTLTGATTQTGALTAAGGITSSTTTTLTGAVTTASTVGGLGSGSMLLTKRVRVVVGAGAGELNNGNGTTGGAVLLAAVSGRKYRVVDFSLIAIGSTAGGGATRIIGTQTTPQVLASATAASLVRSIPTKPNTTNVTLLADGAPFLACDANTDVRLSFDGSSAVTTASNIDVILSYTIE